MAQIALISQFYPPEPCAAANRVSAMARAFSHEGHAVRVYTSLPSFPGASILEPYQNRIHFVERDGDILVERAWTFVGKSHWRGSRALHWLVASLGIAVRLMFSKSKVDLVVMSSPPITLSLPALLYSFVRSAPLLLDVRDVFPEIAIKMGAWKADSLVAKAVGAVADILYRRAKLVTCVTETARAEIIARVVPARKVLLAPNGFDAIEAASEPPYPPLRGIRDVVFVGNMGLATGLNVLLDAASLFLNDRSIRFVLIGAGVDMARLQAKASAAGLTNVIFTGSLPRAQALRALIDAFATIVPLIATIVDSIPTKLFDAMLVGTPIIVSAAGEAKRLVEQANVGLAAEPGDPQSLASALRRILDEPELAARFRANGPPFVRQNYDRAIVMRRLALLVPELTER